MMWVAEMISRTGSAATGASAWGSSSSVAGPDQAPDLARIGNDALAEMAAAHPDRFPGFIASIAYDDPDAIGDPHLW